MELDPIVLLAYVSVSLNLITIIAAVVTYAVFWLRRHSNQRSPRPQSTAGIADSPRIFLQPYVPRASRTPQLEHRLDGSRQPA